MAFMTNEDNRQGLRRKTTRFGMHLRHKGTGGIHDVKVTRCRGLMDFWTHAMSREENTRPFRNHLNGIHEVNPARLQIGDNVFVMNEFVKTPERFARVFRESALCNLKRTGNARTHPVGFGNQNIHSAPYERAEVSCSNNKGSNCFLRDMMPRQRKTFSWFS